MRVLLFVIAVCIAVVVQHRTLRLGYAEIAQRRFEAVSVFLAGGLLAGVFAAIATVTIGVAGRAGFAAFVVLLSVDIAMLVAHNRTTTGRNR